MADFAISSDSDGGEPKPAPTKLYKRKKASKRFFPHKNQAPCHPPDDGLVLSIFEEANAVSLWPQFHSIEPLRNEPEGTSWLEMKVKSPWIESLVRLKRPDLKQQQYTALDGNKKRKMGGGRTRLVAYAAGRELKEMLSDAMRVARLRHPEGSSGPYEEPVPRLGDESEPEEVVQTATFKKRPMITVCIHGHKIVMLNVLTPMYLRADIQTQQFLSEIFLTVVNNGIQKMSKTEKGPPLVKQTLAKFQFAAGPCPGIQGKIHWETQEHSWRLEFGNNQKQRAQPAGLQVDSTLVGAAYAAAKVRTYEHAKSKWNELDTSKRARIPLSGETQVKEEEDDLEEEEDDLETGAQPMNLRWSRDDSF